MSGTHFTIPAGTLVAGLVPLLCACAIVPKATVSIEKVSLEPEERAEGPGAVLTVKKTTTLAYLEIIEQSPNAKSVTQVTYNEDDGVQIGPPILSPVSDDLVYWIYAKDENGDYNSNIWRQQRDAFSRTRVTFGPWLDVYPCFTPDGSNIVFASNRTGTKHLLWRIRAEGGGGITMLSTSRAQDYQPSIGPEGKVIAYASLPTNAAEPQIWTMEASTGMATQLREGLQPRLSPDGSKILHVRKKEKARESDTDLHQIWVMNVDGSAETQLTQNTEYDVLNPSWSPDGKWIAYSSNEGFDSNKLRNYDIWLMASDGTKKTQLTTNGSVDDFPCWDRTAESIYFRSNRGGSWNIWRFAPSLP